MISWCLTQGMYIRLTTWLPLLSIVTAAGCDWLWPLEGEYDPHRCDPPCSAGTRCRGGQCVRDTDGGAPLDKAPKVDKATKKPDRSLVDLAVVESYLPAKKDTGPPCKTGKMECLTGDNVRVCAASKWKYTTCAGHCKSTGDDYSNGCSKHPFTGTVSCNCQKYTHYGGTCTKSTKKCVSGYICGFINNYIYGICTRLCKTDKDCVGGPTGTLALCNMTSTSSQKICGFVCNTYGVPCPKGLSCLSLKSSCRPPSPI